MMAYDLEEQEQLDLIKNWWGRYGNLIVTLIVAASVSAAAYQGWRYYRNQQALQAVSLYAQMENAQRTKENKKAGDIAVQIIDRHSGTQYAAMAALASAKISFESGDLAMAKTRLQWVIEHAREDEMRDVARLRLAGVLLDEKNFDGALKLLEVKPAQAFNGLYADMKGDILVAQGRLSEARSAYRQALDKGDANSSHHQLVQLKLDALGEVK
jgi:predicted negative regulator of RcsB-dependent stress response